MTDHREVTAIRHSAPVREQQQHQSKMRREVQKEAKAPPKNTIRADKEPFCISEFHAPTWKHQAHRGSY